MMYSIQLAMILRPAYRCYLTITTLLRSNGNGHTGATVVGGIVEFVLDCMGVAEEGWHTTRPRFPDLLTCLQHLRRSDKTHRVVRIRQGPREGSFWTFETLPHRTFSKQLSLSVEERRGSREATVPRKQNDNSSSWTVRHCGTQGTFLAVRLTIYTLF